MRRRVLLLARREIVVFGMLESAMALVCRRVCCSSFSPVLLKYLLRRVSSFFCNSWSATMLNE